MAVDRGGLQYTIAVRDEFSRSLSNFRRQIQASKQAFADFQRTAAQSADVRRKATQEEKAAARERARIERTALEATREQIAIEKAASREQRRLDAASAKASREKASAQRAEARARAKDLRDEQRRLKEVVDAENRRVKTAQRLEAARRKDEAAALRDQQRNLKAFADSQLRREKEAKRIFESMRKDEEKAKRLDPNFVAQERLNKGLREEAVQLRQVALLRQRARGQFLSGDVLGGTKSLKQAKELEKTLKGVEKTGNSIFFTFRRLIGILAVFTIARNVVSGFQDLVKSAIEFNDRLVVATTGIAGLVTALADVRDNTGQAVDATKELALAQGIARKQIELLRQDTFRTTASFEQLLDTFQVALAPGFKAGLNIDEIRKSAVLISQAAQAIGVPQEQLAEEIRSLLTGTGQVRTTRLLQFVSNEEIKKARELGNLFELLQKRLGPTAQAAEQIARKSLTGIGNLVRNITTRILGDAANNLFNKLLKTANELFDRFLAVRNAAGEIQPNPKLVQAFKALFDALEVGVDRLKDLGKSLGFEGFERLLRAIGTGFVGVIELAIGFSQVLLTTVNAIFAVLQSVGDALGLTARDFGRIAGVVGVILGSLFVWKQTMGAIGLDFGTIVKLSRDLFTVLRATAVGPAALLLATFVAMGKAVELILQAIFGVDLSFKDTVELVALGLFGALVKVVELTQVLGERISNGVVSAIDAAVNFAVDQALRARSIIATLFGDNAESQKLEEERNKNQLQAAVDAANRRKKAEVEIAQIRQDAAARQKSIEDQIADIIGKQSARQAQGEGFDPNVDPKKFDEAAKAADEFDAIISTSQKEIEALSEELSKLDEELRKTAVEFGRAKKVGGLEGVGGKIEGIFTDQEVENAEKLRQLRQALADTDAAIAAIRTRSVSEQAAAQGQLNSLLTDQKDLTDAISGAERKGLDLSLRRAAIIAAESTPSLQRENEVLALQEAAERRLANVMVHRLGHRREAVVAAENELQIARAELAIAQAQRQATIDAVSARAGQATGEEKVALDALLAALQEQAKLEKDISDSKLKQLEFAKQQAALVESGTLTQGFAEGLKQLTDELPTAFEAGVSIIKESVSALSNFISNAIVDAFDPTDDTSIEEKFARFMQDIARIILNQLVQLAIAKALLGFGVGAQTGGPVVSRAEGGKIPRRGRASPAHYGVGVQGLRLGGPPRGVDPRDTVPMWGQPGEFMMSKRAVDRFGLDFMSQLNEGNFPVPSVAPSGAHALASGNQKGGLITDTLSRAAQSGAAASAGGGGETQILPVMVARPREVDRLATGGRSAMLRFMRENASTINALLEKGRR